MEMNQLTCRIFVCPFNYSDDRQETEMENRKTMPDPLPPNKAYYKKDNEWKDCLNQCGLVYLF